MLVVASAILLLALPVLLWPLLRPPLEEPPEAPPARGRDAVLHAAEEVQLDLASGRLDQAEADRRLAEIRQVAQ